MIAGLLVAGLSLLVTEARVRKLFAAAGVAVAVAVLAFSGPITTWLARGQGSQQLTGLSGRTNFWGPVLAFPRNKFQEIFGFGLSNAQFGGLPIDSNWIASYQQQGLFGIVVCATMLVFLFVTAFFQPRGVQRAAGPVPDDVLPGGVVHRGRVHRRLDVPARHDRGRVAAGAGSREQEPEPGSVPGRWPARTVTAADRECIWRTNGCHHEGSAFRFPVQPGTGQRTGERVALGHLARASTGMTSPC